MSDTGTVTFDNGVGIILTTKTPVSGTVPFYRQRQVAILRGVEVTVGVDLVSFFVPKVISLR